MGSTQFWAQTFSETKNTDLLMVTPTDVVYVSGKSLTLDQTLNGLIRGEDVLPPTKSKSVPRAAVRAVDFQAGHVWVWVRVAGEARPRRVFETLKPNEAQAVAGKLAAELGLDRHPPTESPARLGALTVGPALCAAVLAALFGCLYMAAIHPREPGSKPPAFRSGKAAMFESITNALGANGVLAVGLAIIGICFAYWSYRVVRRPLVFSFGQPMGG